MSVVEGERRLFGVAPAGLAVALGVGLSVLGVVVAALGGWVVAAVLLVAGAAVLGRVRGRCARSRPGSSVVARRSARLLAAGAGWRVFVVRASRLWLAGRDERMRLRRELDRLGADVDGLQFALGATAYRGDGREVDVLRGRLRKLERRRDECAGRLNGLSARVRSDLQRERLAAQRTRALAAARDARDVEARTSPR